MFKPAKRQIGDDVITIMRHPYTHKYLTRRHNVATGVGSTRTCSSLMDAEAEVKEWTRERSGLTPKLKELRRKIACQNNNGF